MSPFYRRDGTSYPLGDEGISELGRDLSNIKMRRVAHDFLPNGVEVSTIWLGIDHGYGSGRPLIFETMLFIKKHRNAPAETWRYATEEEARLGHKMQVKKWSKFKSADQIFKEV